MFKILFIPICSYLYIYKKSVPWIFRKYLPGHMLDGILARIGDIIWKETITPFIKNGDNDDDDDAIKSGKKITVWILYACNIQLGRKSVKLKRLDLFWKLYIPCCSRSEKKKKKNKVFILNNKELRTCSSQRKGKESPSWRGELGNSSVNSHEDPLAHPRAPRRLFSVS